MAKTTIKKDDFFPDSDVSTIEYIDGKRASIKQSKEEIKAAEDNYKLYNASNTSSRQKWTYECFEDFQFFKGSQLTKKERERLKKEKLPIYIVNMITPAIEIMKYFIIANKPMWKYSAVETSDRDAVDVFRALADYCYTKSNGQLKLGKIVIDCLAKSIGYMHIWGDANADRGRGEVKFDFEEFEHVIIDPSSKDPFARDANYIIIAKNLSRSGLLNKFPEYKDKILAVSDAESVETVYTPNYDDDNEIYQEMDTAFNPKDGEQDDYIMYFEVYRMVSIRMNNITLRVVLSEEEQEAIIKKYNQQIKDKQEEYDVLYLERQDQLKRQMEDPDKPIIKERVVFELKRYKQEIDMEMQAFVEKIKKQMNEELYPTKNYQITDEQLSIMEKEYNKNNGSDNFFTNLIVDHTIYYDKRIIVTISLGVDTFLYEKVLPFNNHIIIPLPWFWDGTQKPTSAVKMIKEKQREINKIRQIVIQHAENITNNAWAAEKGVIQNKREWKAAMRTPNGIAEYVGGDDASRKPWQVQQQNIPNSFFPLLTDYKTEFEFLSGITAHLMGAVTSGDEPYRLAMARDEFSTRRLRAWVNSTFEPWLEHVGNVFNMVAKKMYTSHKVFRITQPNSSKTIQHEINIPVYNNKGEIIERLFDYQTIEFDVSVKQGSTLPTNKDAWEERLYRLYKDQAIDDIYYLEHTDLPDITPLLKRKSLYTQLQNKIKQYEDEIKSLKGDIETLRRQLLQSSLKTEELELVRETKNQVEETKMQQKLLREVEKMESKLQQKEMEIEKIKEKQSELKSDDKNKDNKENKNKSKKNENKS